MLNVVNAYYRFPKFAKFEIKSSLLLHIKTSVTCFAVAPAILVTLRNLEDNEFSKQEFEIKSSMLLRIYASTSLVTHPEETNAI